MPRSPITTLKTMSKQYIEPVEKPLFDLYTFYMYRQNLLAQFFQRGRML